MSIAEGAISMYKHRHTKEEEDRAISIAIEGSLPITAQPPNQRKPKDHVMLVLFIISSGVPRNSAELSPGPRWMLAWERQTTQMGAAATTA